MGDSWQGLYNAVMALLVAGSAVFAWFKGRQIKGIENKIPTDTASPATVNNMIQAERDRLQRELGVELDKRDKKIKELETNSKSEIEKRDREILDLQKSVNELSSADTKNKDKINQLNAQIAGMARDIQEERDTREKAEGKAIELKAANFELEKKVAVLEGQVSLLTVIQQTPPPMTVKLIIEGGTVKAEETKAEMVNPT